MSVSYFGNVVSELVILDFSTTLFGNDVGSTNALLVYLNPNLPTLYIGLSINILVANTNTGASTLNLSGFGNINITHTTGSALNANDLLARGIYKFIYDGTNFQLYSSH